MSVGRNNCFQVLFGKTGPMIVSCGARYGAHHGVSYGAGLGVRYGARYGVRHGALDEVGEGR